MGAVLRQPALPDTGHVSLPDWFSCSGSRPLGLKILGMLYCLTYPLSVMKMTVCFDLLTLVLFLNWFNLEGKRKAIIFSFSSVAESLGHSFLSCFVCCLSLVGSQTKIPFVDYFKKCAPCHDIGRATFPRVTLCAEKWTLLNSAHFLCISPTVSTLLLYCVVFDAFHLSRT